MKTNNYPYESTGIYDLDTTAGSEITIKAKPVEEKKEFLHDPKCACVNCPMPTFKNLDFEE